MHRGWQSLFFGPSIGYHQPQVRCGSSLGKRQIFANEKVTPRRNCCSRICNGQSTQEPQGSTRVRSFAVSYSIKSIYFLLISTDFYKRRDLFWDRWSHLHNLHQLNGLQNGRWGARLLFGIPTWNSVGGSPKFTFGCFTGAAIGRPSVGLCRRSRSPAAVGNRE